jgi:hypothetical protein
MILIKLERKDLHICSHSFLDLYDLGNIIKVKGNSKCAPGSTEYQKSKGIDEVLVIALLTGDIERKKHVCVLSMHKACTLKTFVIAKHTMDEKTMWSRVSATG